MSLLRVGVKRKRGLAPQVVLERNEAQHFPELAGLSGCQGVSGCLWVSLGEWQT